MKASFLLRNAKNLRKSRLIFSHKNERSKTTPKKMGRAQKNDGHDKHHTANFDLTTEK